jgi:dihydrofolate reductase
VLTRNPSYDARGADVVTSLEQALAAGDGEVWIAGGAAVYAAALPQADRVLVTDVDGDWDGDVHAPVLDSSWDEVGRDPSCGWHSSSTGVRYRFRELRRRGG